MTNYQKELIQSTELYSQELDEINEKLVRLQEKEEGFYKKSEELMQSEKLFIEEKEQFEERQKNRENELERKEKELKTQEEKMNQTAKEVIEKFDMIKGYQSLVEIQSKYDEIMANIQEKKEELVKMMKEINQSNGILEEKQIEIDNYNDIYNKLIEYMNEKLAENNEKETQYMKEIKEMEKNTTKCFVL